MARFLSFLARICIFFIIKLEKHFSLARFNIKDIKFQRNKLVCLCKPIKVTDNNKDTIAVI